MFARLTGKRLLDVAGAATALAVVSPAFLLIAALVRLIDGAPVFFRQGRYGKGRRPFRILKFRTMQGGQVTRLGAVLRDLGLDELPQLWNVLAGDMALVGPRPLTQADVARLGWSGERFDARWTVRPGLTGLAQLAPTRRCHARTSWLIDHVYIRRRSAALDLRLLAGSALVPLLGKQRLRRVLRARGRRPS
jgi:lipopolysaccharide/colanic/teichoic acid biosynthesis glycosyltransferase